jgi:hypothetical protein
MPYTSPEQLLSEPLEQAASALEDLAVPMRNRLKEPSDRWSDDHLAEIGELLAEVTRLEMRLRRMAREVR